MSGQKVSSVNTPTEGFPVLSTEQLIIEQNKDSELSVLISVFVCVTLYSII
jgi:hypothetical protein